MEVIYQLTQRDFFDSFIAHPYGSTLRKWTIGVAAYGAPIFGGVGLLVYAVSPLTNTLANLHPLFILATLWGVLVWALPWWSARNQYLKQPGAHGPRTALVDAVGVHWRWDGGSSDVEWKNFIRHLESKHLFLLYLSPVMFNTVPKRALTPEQISELRTILARNISQGR
jgi:hypothetical protein